MPPGLEIDHSKPLNGTMAPYSKHVLVFTGQRDWKSKIEDEVDTSVWGRALAEMKRQFGRGGEFHDLARNVLVSASSWEQKIQGGQGGFEAVVFPDFLHTRFQTLKDGEYDEGALREFCRDVHDGSLHATSSSTVDGSSPVQHLEFPTILICSHGSRDNRCGVLGPILHEEFRRALATDYPTDLSVATETSKLDLGKVNIGMISHIGGHKWAGNVIVYIPPKWRIDSQKEGEEGDLIRSPLAGTGIWYGRVEPKHVEGIIQETLVKGRVIEDLFRGGIDQKGQILRIP